MVQHSSFNVWEGGTEKELKILFFLTAQKNDAVGNAHRGRSGTLKKISILSHSVPNTLRFSMMRSS